MMYFDEVGEALDGRLSLSHRLALGVSALAMSVAWLPFLNGFGVVEISASAAASLVQ